MALAKAWLEGQDALVEEWKANVQRVAGGRESPPRPNA